MAILVTGGAGYIGSHTAKALRASGLEPVVLDNLSNGHRDAVRWGPFVEGDIADRELLSRVFRQYAIEGVIHFAAHAYVGESMTAPRRYFGNNAVGTLALLDAMLDAGISRFVFSSTCATYGIPERVPIDEAHPQRPVNPYGESKLFVERVLRWYGEAYGVRSVALRYFNAAGADPDGEIGERHDPETHLIPIVLEAIAGRRACVEIYGSDYPTADGTAIRDYIHVTDLATAHLLALRHTETKCGFSAFNLGTGEGHSVREVIRAAEQATGRAAPVRESPRRPGDPPALVANASLAARILGWNARHSGLDTIVRTAWDWLSIS